MTRLIRLGLFLFGTIICTDCLILFVYLKINFGTIVPFLIGLIFLIHALFWQKIQTLITKKAWLKRAWQMCWGLFILWCISFIMFVGVLIQQINQAETTSDYQAIIVLGSGVNGDRPTPTLASRLDTAAPVIKNQPDSVAITSGGVGFGREVSEAYVMAKYLADDHNIDINRIQQEGESTSTEENLMNSIAILNKHGVNMKFDKVLIVTSDFHTVRAKAIANNNGYENISTLPSPTPLSIRANAWFREYFAYVSGWILGEY